MVDVREQEGNELVAVPHDGQTSTEMGFTGMTSASISGALAARPLTVTDTLGMFNYMYEALLLPLMRDEKITIIHWKTTRTYLAQRTRKSPNSQTKKQALTNESSKPLDN